MIIRQLDQVYSLLELKILVSHRKCLSECHATFPPCRDQNQQSWESPQYPATSYPTSSLWNTNDDIIITSSGWSEDEQEVEGYHSSNDLTQPTCKQFLFHAKTVSPITRMLHRNCRLKITCKHVHVVTVGTHHALGSLKTSVWMCIIKSPPGAYSITKPTWVYVTHVDKWFHTYDTMWIY